MRAFLCFLVVSAGCAAQLEQRGAPATPFDAVLVPGCPCEADGSLSRCQMARALWAAQLWERGFARHFITSGAAVYTPYVEAEALAQALTALGVPPSRIWVEPNALHTDENMFYSLQIARALGYRRLAVASNGASFDCLMLQDWGQDCRAFTLDLAEVRAQHARHPGRLEAVRARRVSRFQPLAEREREIAARTGRHRPPSFALYLGMALLRSNGERWVPANAPLEPPLLRWSTLASALVARP